MKLRIYNKTSSDITYLGIIVIPANSFLDIDPEFFNALEVDPSLRHDILTNLIDISDTITRYGNNDGITQLDYMAGLRDREGKGISSTLFDSHQALDVNVVNPIDVSLGVLPPSNVKSIIKYNEQLMVASGSETTLLTYTVPLDTRSVIQRIFVSGGNPATYTVNYNSDTIAKKRTYFTYYNETFDFVENLNNGFILEAGDTLDIIVLQVRPDPADFESTLQIIEIT